MKPWNLAQTNYATVKQHNYEVAVLPLGATEPHNLHLPYGTDLFEGTIVGEKICEAAWNDGAKVVLLPTIPYGTETNMREFPLAINVNPSTLNRIIEDIVESLLQSGIRKVVLLNSHGGNGLKPSVISSVKSIDVPLVSVVSVHVKPGKLGSYVLRYRNHNPTRRQVRGRAPPPYEWFSPIVQSPISETLSRQRSSVPSRQ